MANRKYVSVALALRQIDRKKMTAFIAALSPGRASNWDICRATGLWGIVDAGTNWRSNLQRLAVGDTIYVWQGGKGGGLKAKTRVAAPAVSAALSPLIPWEPPSAFGATVPISIIEEFRTPVGDSFTGPGRTSLRFGIQNSALQHVFEALPVSTELRIETVFGKGHATPFGIPYDALPTRTTVAEADPMPSDPELLERAIYAHRLTIHRLATWVRSQGLVPLLPRSGEPFYDLAWMEGDVLNVAEVKSITDANEESQLRLGLGQILRYRTALATSGVHTQAWLVPERAPADSTWIDTCGSVGVELRAV